MRRRRDSCSGVPLAVPQPLLGHPDPELTARVYERLGGGGEARRGGEGAACSALGGVYHRPKPHRRDSMPMPADNWPFEQPRDSTAISSRSIVNGGEPILFVSHDLDDHGWQFLGLEDAHEEDACLIALEEVVVLDRRVLELADLPPGWCAWRPDPTSAWQRAPDMAEGEPTDSAEHSP